MPALRISGLSKRLGQTQALQDVSMVVEPGSIHALLGGNGSGKSTLIKVLAGVHTGDSGSVTVGDRTVEAARMTPQWARAAGLRFVHQDLGVFLPLTVAENISLSRGYARRGGVGISWRQVERDAAEVLSGWQIPAQPRDVMQDVRPADRTMIAIARALSTPLEGGAPLSDDDRPPFLVLDEPTSALPEKEVERLLAWVRQSARTGDTVMFVTHRLEEVLAVADDITALRDGHHQATRPCAGLARHDLVQLIAPSADDEAAESPPVTRSAATAAATSSTPRVGVRDLRGGPLHGVTFDVAPGELVGVAGLLGSGRTTLLQNLAGVWRPDAGEIELDGVPFTPYPERKAIRAGIALVPENRADDGLFPGLTIAENIQAATLGVTRATAPALTPWLRAAARRTVRDYGIVAGSVNDDILTLSGGNQQKVLLARWLAIGPRLILLDDPSVGVDVGARAALHRIIQAAVAEGAAALCASSDLYELVELCDRVLVLRDGVIADELRGDRLTTHALGLAIHGGTKGEEA